MVATTCFHATTCEEFQIAFTTTRMSIGLRCFQAFTKNGTNYEYITTFVAMDRSCNALWRSIIHTICWIRANVNFVEVNFLANSLGHNSAPLFPDRKQCKKYTSQSPMNHSYLKTKKRTFNSLKTLTLIQNACVLKRYQSRRCEMLKKNLRMRDSKTEKKKLFATNTQSWVKMKQAQQQRWHRMWLT